jgi:hypothetical protein
MSSRYRKKQVEVEAVQWTGDEESAREIEQWSNGAVAYTVGDFTNVLAFDLRGGQPVSAHKGHWIVLGHRFEDEYYPLTADQFKATYEPAGQERGELEGQEDDGAPYSSVPWPDVYLIRRPGQFPYQHAGTKGLAVAYLRRDAECSPDEPPSEYERYVPASAQPVLDVEGLRGKLLSQAERFEADAAEVSENPTIASVKRIQAETIRSALATALSDLEGSRESMALEEKGSG